ncbi:MAG TPA: glycosyl hydrolase family 79 C-terminal domain-containing protein [Terracidiphilus sp.]|nr:glycosyl hydrolase family 79 C-terminal domain-containing protein [Terracidiphilus sp.]
MLTRRTFLNTVLKSSAGLALFHSRTSLADAGSTISLRLSAERTAVIAEDFIGLGYEMSSIAPLGLLSISNHKYVALVNALGRKGVLRVGGIVADYTRYEPHGRIIADRQNTVITDASLHQFAAFLREIGWRAIWSLNFAQGTIQDAVTEAKAVANALGRHLLAIELGNEVDNYGRGRSPFRPPSWDYASYLKEYQEWHAAIIRAAPQIPFAAPDTASSIEWVELMAKDSAGQVQLLTTHYYRSNRAHGTAEELLLPDPRLKDVIMRLRTVSQQSGIPWRMCETNSFSGGGLPGVSNTFIDALWVLDYMLLLAQSGCSGVNIETGVNQLGFISSYSPIQDDGTGTNSAGVPYYGMLAFAEAQRDCDQILPVDADMQGINASVYLLGASGKPRSAVVVNRDRSRQVGLSFKDLPLGNVTVLRLEAPSPDSKIGVTFAGSSVDADGNWKATKKEQIRNGIVTVPAMSAIVARAASSRI